MTGLVSEIETGMGRNSTGGWRNSIEEGGELSGRPPVLAQCETDPSHTLGGDIREREIEKGKRCREHVSV